ncbi:MAG TPA: fused response regulator/phosphatase [Verrucomicrobiae bacterium]|jgi:sigma-B regulation protein RsbU (phosphoserine phosphatase)|nr:fused response regulator/phosphatase [Verrucomicrobiae bacterium]
MEVAQKDPASADQSDPTSPPLRITALLIEDNPADARLIQYMLIDSGDGIFQLEHVDHLAKGLKRMESPGIDIVLSDLSLPDSHGLETFTRLHAQAPQIPIIVLTGLNDTTVAVNAVHEGAQDFLVKGQVDGPSLTRAIRYAIERKRMSEQLHRYADELRKKNAQLEADFNMAREIQQIFLPNEYPTFPGWATAEESALKFAHRYIPAAAVGGDFFDFFAIDDTTGGVFICDVMGHGMRAALITAIMRGLIEELMSMAGKPGKFLTEINRSLRAILRQTREPFLATAFYAVVDVATGEMQFANAGHPSPFYLNREGGSVEPLKNFDSRHGPALGLFERSIYPACKMQVNTGDVLLLFTDGIYEVQSAGEEEFGQERLLEFFRSRHGLAPGELFDALLADVQEFSGANEFEDDVCLASVEVCKVGLEGK